MMYLERKKPVGRDRYGKFLYPGDLVLWIPDDHEDRYLIPVSGSEPIDETEYLRKWSCGKVILDEPLYEREDTLCYSRYYSAYERDLELISRFHRLDKDGFQMSYWASLDDPVTGETIKLDWNHAVTGGTYKLGGDNELELNITYNYSSIFHKVIDGGIKALEGMSGAESISILQSAIDDLADDVDDDYWKATEGNAKKALCGLLSFAQLRPDGIWRIS